VNQQPEEKQLKYVRLLLSNGAIVVRAFAFEAW